MDTSTTPSIEMTRDHAFNLARVCLRCARRWLTGRTEYHTLEQRVQRAQYHLECAAKYRALAKSFAV